MSMAATKISRFFIIFTALLLDKIAGYKAKETRTTTGRLTRLELTSDLNNFQSKGPMKSGDPPTETDQANWKKRTSKETATAQQPRDQYLFTPFKTFFRPRLHRLRWDISPHAQRDNESKPMDCVHYDSP
jgi:hypothetical protein